jgi:hypothetical protein
VKSLIAIVLAGSAILFTAGCAVHGDAVASGVESPYAGYAYDGFYDDFYGPFDDGYWGTDGFFYFSDGHGGFRRDDEHHFRHEGADGFHGIHTAHNGFGPGGEGPRAAGDEPRGGFGIEGEGRAGFAGGGGGGGRR